MQSFVANRGASPAAPCNITVEVVAALATVKGSVSEKTCRTCCTWVGRVAVAVAGECQDPWVTQTQHSLDHSFTWTMSNARGFV